MTPVLAMLHSLVSTSATRPIWFIHGAKNGAEQAYAAEVRRMSDRLPNPTAHFRYSRPRDVDFMGRDHDSIGRVDDALLRDMVPDDAEFYLCGPRDFMIELRNALLERNISRDRIRVEAFDAGSSDAAQEPSVGEVTVRFDDSETEATWQPMCTSLLDLAEAAGLSPIHSCRTGSCGTCEHALLSGSIFYSAPPLFDAAPGNVLLCCAKPLSDVVIGQPISNSKMSD